MSAGWHAEDLAALLPRLRRYARALTASREAADDLTQDTLERAWARRTQWQTGSDLRAWLFTLMHNVFVSGLRRVRPADSLEQLEETGQATPRAAPSAAEGGIVLAELERALARLPEEQREVLLLVGLEQFSYAEAAAVLGVPIGTVMSRLSRGRERLRELLDQPVTTPSALRRVK